MILSLALFNTAALAAKSYPVDGIVVAVDPAARSMLVAHRPIAKYMPAMTMPFRVAEARELEGLYPGVRIRFELVVTRNGSSARNLRKAADGDVVIPPPKDRLKIGDDLPDFRLMDEQGRTVTLADVRGKVLAVNFIYTRCPLPDVCPRLAANFAALQHRFQDRLGRDLMLLSITVDPEYDTPAVLSEYAKRWRADRRGWRFLTGDVSRIAALLGEVYWTDEGSIGHNSVTTVIGRGGRVAAMVDGPAWRLDQFAGLIVRELEENK